ncbi:MAG: hypothetical protein ACETVZ_08865 [Phycisphaerae bacterium]
MVLISSGIEAVRAFELPNGIWADGGYVGAPRIALVRWRSSWTDMFYQIYVNGQFAGATIDSQQRQEIIQIPTSFESPVRIEVFAVAAEHAHIDFSNELDMSLANSGRVRMSLLRGQNLPISATAQIYFDHGTGDIDYDKALNNSPIKVWPAWQDKAGFAMSSFGTGDFGYDSAAAVGFGKGSFGHGQFGLDADTFEWIGSPMPAGLYKFGVKITDDAGNESASNETGQVTVTPAAEPAEHLSIVSFEKQTNQLVLKIKETPQ